MEEKIDMEEVEKKIKIAIEALEYMVHVPKPERDHLEAWYSVKAREALEKIKGE